MPYQEALAHRLVFEPGSPDYETTALPTELSRLLMSIMCQNHGYDKYPLDAYYVQTNSKGIVKNTSDS